MRRCACAPEVVPGGGAAAPPAGRRSPPRPQGAPRSSVGWRSCLRSQRRRTNHLPGGPAVPSPRGVDPAGPARWRMRGPRSGGREHMDTLLAITPTITTSITSLPEPLPAELTGARARRGAALGSSQDAQPWTFFVDLQEQPRSNQGAPRTPSYPNIDRAGSLGSSREGTCAAQHGHAARSRAPHHLGPRASVVPKQDHRPRLTQTVGDADEDEVRDRPLLQTAEAATIRRLRAVEDRATSKPRPINEVVDRLVVTPMKGRAEISRTKGAGGS